MDSYMETEFLHLQPHNHHHNQQQPNSGLLRFRSAPSSLLNEFTHSSADPEKHTGRFEEDEFSESSYERKPQRLNSQNGYSGLAQLPPQYPKQHLGSAASSSIQRSNSLETDQSMSRGLNLSRQNSSPAGFFNHLNPQNDYTIMRGIGNGTNEESSPRLNHLPQIPEIVNVNIKETNPQDLFPFTSWNDSASKSGGLASNPNTLTHHLSLPKTALRFQDTVPCKVRARRGYATHPRSIAERERRNRISERMRKLQELVPNMDKQTNTADMLDLAVEYIKNLQNHHKVLNENQTKCKCVNLQQSSPN